MRIPTFAGRSAARTGTAGLAAIALIATGCATKNDHGSDSDDAQSAPYARIQVDGAFEFEVRAGAATGSVGPDSAPAPASVSSSAPSSSTLSSSSPSPSSTAAGQSQEHLSCYRDAGRVQIQAGRAAQRDGTGVMEIFDVKLVRRGDTVTEYLLNIGSLSLKNQDWQSSTWGAVKGFPDRFEVGGLPKDKDFGEVTTEVDGDRWTFRGKVEGMTGDGQDTSRVQPRDFTATIHCDGYGKLPESGWVSDSGSGR
ncbi:hypothetical protein GOHSU_46_00020 [Gordonia hirsuta DSM 44140 = NBRC 16056]|uniref:Lipoprotein n=1 Tax=Gordonia hirsuta DSM 44140 = NBRC 16056 TaxID=1121927 RepID=L7LD48_9ACTN|nr:hypothetical protein [Gordonia hirsuta]GAC58681.1 hypothetical protein GOHSU_46_00020 [Gordonia hirsuta DSM 44140 = NBRC 16056]